MKAVNVDDVLKILHKYGRYIFVTDEKKYSEMVHEIANLKALKQEPMTGYISIDDVMSVFDDFMCGDVDEEGTEAFLEMLKDKVRKRG